MFDFFEFETKKRPVWQKILLTPVALILWAVDIAIFLPLAIILFAFVLVIAVPVHLYECLYSIYYTPKEDELREDEFEEE